MPASYKDKLLNAAHHVTVSQANAAGWEETARLRHQLLMKLFRVAASQSAYVTGLPYSGDEVLADNVTSSTVTPGPGNNDKMASYVVKTIDWLVSRVAVLQNEVCDLTQLIDIVDTNREAALCDMHSHEEEPVTLMDEYASDSSEDSDSDEEDNPINEGEEEERNAAPFPGFRSSPPPRSPPKLETRRDSKVHNAS